MNVRYNPLVAGAVLVVGILATALDLWLILLGNGVPGGIVIGIILIVLGVLYFVRPYFRVDGSSVTRPALLGPMKKEFPFTSLEVDGGKLYAVDARGDRKKLPLAKWSAHGGDWSSVAAQTLPR